VGKLEKGRKKGKLLKSFFRFNILKITGIDISKLGIPGQVNDGKIRNRLKEKTKPAREEQKR